MINFLLYYQFPFLYLMLLIIGLAVYGSDFDTATGYIYTVPLLVFPIIHKWGRGLVNIINRPAGFRSLCVVGGLSGVLAYGPLHFGFWDEHSLPQAMLVSVVGVCSYFLSASIASRADIDFEAARVPQIGAVLVIATIWTASAVYPLFAMFGLAMIMLLSAIWYQSNIGGSDITLSATVIGADVIAKYMMFLLAMDLGFVVWDYQVNTNWSLPLALTFAAVAAGIYAFTKRTDRLERTIYSIAVANFLIGILWADYLISVAHSVIIGFVLGYLLQRVIYIRELNDKNRLSLAWSVWFFVGFALGYGLYANIAFAHWRFVFILPFILLMVAVFLQNTLQKKN